MSVTLSETRTPLYTAEYLLNFAGDARFELIEGKLIPMAPTSDDHGEKTIRLSAYIFSYVDEHNLGDCFAAETGFLLARNPDVVLAPDFAFIAKARLTYPRGAGFVPIAPDLVVETRSPSDRPAAVADKMAMWLSHGVRLALDVAPAKRELIVYQPGVEPVWLGIKDSFEGFDVLPGFSMPLARLFRV